MLKLTCFVQVWNWVSILYSEQKQPLESTSSFSHYFLCIFFKDKKIDSVSMISSDYRLCRTRLFIKVVAKMIVADWWICNTTVWCLSRFHQLTRLMEPIMAGSTNSAGNTHASIMIDPAQQTQLISRWCIMTWIEK